MLQSDAFVSVILVSSLLYNIPDEEVKTIKYYSKYTNFLKFYYRVLEHPKIGAALRIWIVVINDKFHHPLYIKQLLWDK